MVTLCSSPKVWKWPAMSSCWTSCGGRAVRGGRRDLRESAHEYLPLVIVSFRLSSFHYGGRLGGVHLLGHAGWAINRSLKIV
jgi:hypothetical protein